MKDIILYFAIKYFGDWERIYDAVEEQEEVNFEEIEKIKSKLKNKYLTILDDDYPKELKFTSKPPFVLFFKGKKSLLNQKNKIWYYGNYFNENYKKIIIKHSRECEENNITLISGYTNEFEKSFINHLETKNKIIVKDSGIDSYITMTRVEEKYLLQDNLIISEYPDKVIPSLQTWKMSARIKYGLSKNVLLINSLKERITFQIISDAIEEGRKIHCYEKIVDKKSHNSILISKGAYAINSMKEIKGN